MLASVSSTEARSSSLWRTSACMLPGHPVATAPELWSESRCLVEGAGYGGEGLDAVHAEDMSLVPIGGGRYRMYYAACDRDGKWRIASAVTA